MRETLIFFLINFVFSFNNFYFKNAKKKKTSKLFVLVLEEQFQGLWKRIQYDVLLLCSPTVRSISWEFSVTAVKPVIMTFEIKLCQNRRKPTMKMIYFFRTFFVFMYKHFLNNKATTKFIEFSEQQFLYVFLSVHVIYQKFRQHNSIRVIEARIVIFVQSFSLFDRLCWITMSFSRINIEY